MSEEKKVVNFKLAEPPPPAVCPDVVEALEDLLQRAKDGRVHSFVAVFMDAGSMGYAVIGEMERKDMITYAGMISVIQNDFGTQVLEDLHG